MQMFRGYRYRIYPTSEQRQQFGKLFMTVRFVYNSLLLQWMKDSRLDFQQELSCLVNREKWLKFIHSSILEHSARQLEQACRRYEQARTIPVTSSDYTGNSGRLPAHSAPGAGFPHRKSRKDARFSFTLSGRNIMIQNGKLLLNSQPGIKPVKIVLSRRIPQSARICSVTISMSSTGRYYASLLCVAPSAGTAFPLSSPRNTFTGKTVGLDYSLSSFFVASDPALKPDKCYLMNARKSRKKLAAANRRLSAMQYGSNNHERQRKVIAGIYEHIRNQRTDYLQKLSTLIADQYDIVCVETLDLVEMEQKCHGYARRIADNGWEDFIHMLDYKLKERGKILVRVDKWFPSSKICHECSYINRDLTVSERTWICPICGAKLNRDINASRNIRDEGLRILRAKKHRSTPLGKAPFHVSGGSGWNRNAPAGCSEPSRPYLSDYRIKDERKNSLSSIRHSTGSFWTHGPYGWEYCSGFWDSPVNTGIDFNCITEDGSDLPEWQSCSVPDDILSDVSGNDPGSAPPFCPPDRLLPITAEWQEDNHSSHSAAE